jgi:hypothetical protein
VSGFWATSRSWPPRDGELSSRVLASTPPNLTHSQDRGRNTLINSFLDIASYNAYLAEKLFQLFPVAEVRASTALVGFSCRADRSGHRIF